MGALVVMGHEIDVDDAMRGTASVAIAVSVPEILPTPIETLATSVGMAIAAARQNARRLDAVSLGAPIKRSAALATSQETTSTSSCPMGMALGNAFKTPETFMATSGRMALATSEVPVEVPFKVVI